MDKEEEEEKKRATLSLSCRNMSHAGSFIMALIARHELSHMNALCSR
jgi:hypothetical protein